MKSTETKKYISQLRKKASELDVWVTYLNGVIHELEEFMLDQEDEEIEYFLNSTNV